MSEKIEPGTIWERRTGWKDPLPRVQVKSISGGRVFWVAYERGRREPKRGSIWVSNWHGSYKFVGACDV
ncbi:hypothetical protein [Pseudoclavibacter helvolus]|uniref:hypothetical protein n=1 Tax=Pseudoclavibacter helvolus TaxID=255205 RepID=UPI003C717770